MEYIRQYEDYVIPYLLTLPSPQQFTRGQGFALSRTADFN